MCLFINWCNVVSIKQSIIRAIGILTLIFTLPFGGALASVGSHPLELGLTPSHVFSIWVNINKALVTISTIVSDNPVWQREIKSMKPRMFKGKIPADVLVHVERLEFRIDQSWTDIKTMPAWLKTSDHKEVTPSKVFLASGHVLNDVIAKLIDISDSNLLVSSFYARHTYMDKTPNDVFGLVDLAHRRLDQILIKVVGKE